VIGDGEGVLKRADEPRDKRKGKVRREGRPRERTDLGTRLTLFDLISFKIPAGTQFFSPRSPLEASAAFFSSLTTRSPIVSGAMGASW